MPEFNMNNSSNIVTLLKRINNMLKDKPEMNSNQVINNSSLPE